MTQPTKDQQCPMKGQHMTPMHRDACPVCNPDKTVPELQAASAAHLPSKEQLLSRLRDGIAAADGNLSRNETVVTVHSHWLKDTCHAALASLQSTHEPCAAPFGWYDYEHQKFWPAQAYTPEGNPNVLALYARPSPPPPDVLTKQRDHWRKQCRDLQDILRSIGECISGHDGHVFDDVHALLEQSQALKAPISVPQPPDVHSTEYKIGDRVNHCGHITEVIGLSVKYMLCGGAVVYGHDLQPASRPTKEEG